MSIQDGCLQPMRLPLLIDINEPGFVPGSRPEFSDSPAMDTRCWTFSAETNSRMQSAGELQS